MQHFMDMAIAGRIVIDAGHGERLAPALRSAVAAARRVLGVERAAAVLAVSAWHDDLIAAQDGSEPPIPLRTLRAAIRCVRAAGAVAAPDLADERGPGCRAAVAAGIRSVVVVPLRVGDAGGCLLAAADAPRAFTLGDVAALEAVAACAAAAAVPAESGRTVRALEAAVGRELRAIVGNLDRLDGIVSKSPPEVVGAAARARALQALEALRLVVDELLDERTPAVQRVPGVAALADALPPRVAGAPTTGRPIPTRW
jgi:hypothetical protein